MSKKLAMIAMPMTANLHLADKHSCADCNHSAFEAAVAIEGAFTVSIQDQLEDIEDSIATGADSAAYDIRERMSDAHAMSSDGAYMAQMLAGHAMQVAAVDQLFASKTPWQRIAFLAQQQRNMMWATLAATGADADKVLGRDQLSERVAKMMQTAHAMENDMIGFQDWLQETIALRADAAEPEAPAPSVADDMPDPIPATTATSTELYTAPNRDAMADKLRSMLPPGIATEQLVQQIMAQIPEGAGEITFGKIKLG